MNKNNSILPLKYDFIKCTGKKDYFIITLLKLERKYIMFVYLKQNINAETLLFLL